MPDRLIEERFDRLSGAVESAIDQLTADRLERNRVRRAEAKRVKAEEKRAKWYRALTIGATVGALAALVGGWFTHDLYRDMAADRRDVQLTSCVQQVEDRLSFNLTLLSAMGFGDDGQPGEFFTAADPASQARRRAVLMPREVDGVQRGGLRPLRVCTEDAIAAYFESGGRDGIVPIDGEDDDFSEAVTVP